MKEQVKNVFNSAPCEIAMLLILCSMIVTTLALKADGAWTVVSATAAIAGTAVFAWLLVWVSYKVIKRVPVKAMAPKPLFAVETCTWILLLYWFYIAASWIVALIWLPFVVWAVIRSAKSAFATEQ